MTKPEFVRQVDIVKVWGVINNNSFIKRKSTDYISIYAFDYDEAKKFAKDPYAKVEEVLVAYDKSSDTYFELHDLPLIAKDLKSLEFKSPTPNNIKILKEELTKEEEELEKQFFLQNFLKN